jgi:hypothetical protein
MIAALYVCSICGSMSERGSARPAATASRARSWSTVSFACPGGVFPPPELPAPAPPAFPAPPEFPWPPPFPPMPEFPPAFPPPAPLPPLLAPFPLPAPFPSPLAPFPPLPEPFPLPFPAHAGTHGARASAASAKSARRLLSILCVSPTPDPVRPISFPGARPNSSTSRMQMIRASHDEPLRLAEGSLLMLDRLGDRTTWMTCPANRPRAEARQPLDSLTLHSCKTRDIRPSVPHRG